VNIEHRPVACEELQKFDYEVRIVALKLLRTKLDGLNHWLAADIEELLTHPQRRDVIACLTALGASSFLEYYGGWDTDSAEGAIVREIELARNLAGDDLAGDLSQEGDES
jgi:hypothetical protein